MFKSLDSIASVVGIFMYLTISKLKQVLRSRKGLDYNTANIASLLIMSSLRLDSELFTFSRSSNEQKNVNRAQAKDKPAWRKTLYLTRPESRFYFIL